MALWYGDIRADMPGWLKALLPNVDVFFFSSGGEILSSWHEAGGQAVSAFFFNPALCEEDLPSVGKVHKRYPVVFTGSPYGFADESRLSTVKYLVKRGDTEFRGGAEQLYYRNLSFFGKNLNRILKKVGIREVSPLVRGPEYLELIKRGKIGVGINGFQDIPMYSSDRMTHYLEAGTFYLAGAFPGLEKLFTVGKELESFSSVEELDEKISFYLENEGTREKIAARARETILSKYNARDIVRYMLDIIRSGKSELFEDWEVIS